MNVIAKTIVIASAEATIMIGNTDCLIVLRVLVYYMLDGWHYAYVVMIHGWDYAYVVMIDSVSDDR